MDWDFSSTCALESLLGSLEAGQEASRLATQLIPDEKALFQLFSNVCEPGACRRLARLSFCLAVLALDEWKASPGSLELPLLVHNYFQRVEEFLCFSFVSLAPVSFAQLAPVLRAQAALGPLLMFLPRRPAGSERRLYAVDRAAVLKLIRAKSWQKLLDPRDCECWIHLPSKSSGLSRNFSLELKEELAEDSLAKRLIKRREKKNFSFKSVSSETRFSLFKKNKDANEKPADRSGSELLHSPLSVKNISQITLQSQSDPRDPNLTLQNFSRFLASSSPHALLAEQTHKHSPRKTTQDKPSPQLAAATRPLGMRIPDPDTLDFDFELDEGARHKPSTNRFSFDLRKRNLFIK